MSSSRRIAAIDLVRLASILVVFAVPVHASGIARVPETALARDL